VSGFALGVDIAAHLAALRYGLPTVGVLPTGIDSVYPHQHRGVAAQVCETPGCALITDYPPETVPLKVNFLRRNRIIAGMTKATILVESKERGGGMMTARLAWSYEREVYALPGRVDDIRSGGCNILIGEKIAEPIYSLKALTESLQLGSAAETQTAGDLAEEIKTRFTSVYGEKAAEEMGIIVYLIKKRRQPTIDEIALQSGLEYQMVRSHASLLELEGIIGIDLLQRCVLRHR
nr:DNA-protecting protein DprA [Bacteroidales bacterium]